MSAELAAKVASLEARITALENAAPGGLPEVNIDDPKYGDPDVRKDPPRWKGDSYKGHRYSECPVDYLRALAGFKQWAAKKEAAEGKTKYAGYSMSDAAKALAWAKRKELEASRYGTSGHGASAKHSAPPERDDWADAEAEATQGQYDDDPLPF